MIDCQARRELVVDSSPEALFDIVADVKNHHKLAGSGEVQSIRKVTEGPVGVGTVMEANEKLPVADQSMGGGRQLCSGNTRSAQLHLVDIGSRRSTGSSYPVVLQFRRSGGGHESSSRCGSRLWPPNGPADDRVGGKLRSDTRSICTFRHGEDPTEPEGSCRKLSLGARGMRKRP